MTRTAKGGAVRRFVRDRAWLRKVYLWAKYAPGAEIRRRRILREHGAEWTRERQQTSLIAALGVYDLQLPLENPTQSYEGRNFLGYPPMSAITLDGEEIGWHYGPKLPFDDYNVPSFQVKTDLEVNLPLLFATYRPGYVVDFGTAFGASSVLFARLMTSYHPDGKVLTIDINDPTKGPHGRTFVEALRQLPITSYVGDALDVSTQNVVRGFLEQRQDESVLLSFDDDHSAQHVLQELKTYAPLIRPGDAIVVQDTWDQGFRDTPLSALLGVLRFLNEEEQSFELDISVLRALALPCSFVHGVIVMKVAAAGMCDG